MMRKIVVSLSLLCFSLFAEKILLVNSNADIQRYRDVETEFAKSFSLPFQSINLENMSNDAIKNYFYDEYPDIVYAIGAKAYQYANRYIPEKTIFFSSIVNYSRLDMRKNRYGVSNELVSGFNLTLIHSLFPKQTKLSLIYSDYTQNLFESYKENCERLGIELIAQKISSTKEVDMDTLLQGDALVLIADPVLIKASTTVKSIFAQMNAHQKPIFAYHELFLTYGAVLSIAIDNPTIARQVAYMMDSLLLKRVLTSIQLPMGTHVIFNKKQADSLKLDYNIAAMPMVNTIIEN